MNKKLVRLEIAVLIALILANSFSFLAFSKQCDDIRGKLLRMHVIANSNSDEDQELKLKVRDALLIEGKEIFDGSITVNEATEKILPYLDELELTAQRVIIENGYNYDVKITVQKEFFKTRTYDNQITLPAGEYTAVKVIIGEGKGENWWCVMFPPMCLPAAGSKTTIDDVLNSKEMSIVNNGKRYLFRFKFIEIFEELFK